MNINPPKLVPHPNLVIEEGEEWIRGAIDPLSISTYGDECGHYTAPENSVSNSYHNYIREQLGKGVVEK